MLIRTKAITMDHPCTADFYDSVVETLGSGYIVLKKYECVYRENLKRLARFGCFPYAIPSEGKPYIPYLGTDRDPLDHDCRADSMPDDLQEAELIRDGNGEYEVMFFRVAGCDDPLPEGVKLLGYDASYPLADDLGFSDGFSAIGDCMFNHMWHGCDDEGTYFLDHYNNLNSNGLFDDAAAAWDYIKHYLSWEGAESGDYLVCEIYSFPALTEKPA